MKINIAIDRLVLDGIDIAAADRPRLRAAVESELARLIAGGGISGGLAGGIAVPSVPASSIAIAASRSPRELGSAIAGSVYGGIGRRS
jgi:hypothetical protein